MKKYLLTLFILTLCIPQIIFAAKFSLEIQKDIPKESGTVAKVIIESEGDSVNALSGEIVLPEGIIVEKIFDGESAVTLWVEKPTLMKDERTISFSGLTPGGITGVRTLFTFVFSSKNTGIFPFVFRNLTALKNDGKGTALKTSSIKKQIAVTSMKSSQMFSLVDTTPPEIFKPVISSNSELFGGENFMTFVAQDKGAGIDHYEYATRFFGSPGEKEWQQISSPFVIPHDVESHTLYVKAVDKLGNERIASVTGLSYYTFRVWWGIIIVLFITCALYFSKRYFS